jgi:hypothetical protein
MRITKEQLKRMISEMIDPETGESPDQIGGMVAEIDEIIERNMAEGTVDSAVYELQDWTADDVAEYAGTLTSMDKAKAMFIIAVERDMEY